MAWSPETPASWGQYSEDFLQNESVLDVTG